VSAASGLVEDLGAHRCMPGSLMEDRKAPLHETAVRAVGSKEDGPREEMSLLRVHYHEQRRSENLRSGIEGSSTECTCSATLMLSCLTTEEERTISEQHEELDAEILDHYEEGLERDRLLGGGAGRLEYLRTRELLARYLPPPPATVLDVGGGAGVYALPLAREGY
jgi:2-polyprenyl-3-methyl-5-hydroxy-6-metoxy-1,4-benzoquinol methylase